jgi:hypothetical protein
VQRRRLWRRRLHRIILKEKVSMDNSEKRKTVNVNNALGRPIMLHLHQTISDDGGGRPFQGRMLTPGEDPDLLPVQVQLQSGHNAGIDKEFFDKWKEQNSGFSLLRYFTAEDESEPESAERKENDDGSRRDVDSRPEADEVPGRLPGAVEGDS